MVHMCILRLSKWIILAGREGANKRALVLIFKRNYCIHFSTFIVKEGLTISVGLVACENILFSSLFAAGDVLRGNVPSGEERGETDVFAGYGAGISRGNGWGFLVSRLRVFEDFGI